MTDIKDKFKNYKPYINGYKNMKKAAVLIPLVKKDNSYSILFELRSKTMKRQPGEISFPGGIIENNESPKEACLRETLEEIAPPVAENLRFHNNDSIQVGFDDMHKCCVYGPYFPRFCRLRCGTNGSTRKPLPFHLALSRRAACF